MDISQPTVSATGSYNRGEILGVVSHHNKAAHESRWIALEPLQEGAPASAVVLSGSAETLTLLRAALKTKGLDITAVTYPAHGRATLSIVTHDNTPTRRAFCQKLSDALKALRDGQQQAHAAR